jgi:hypothetical protein
MKKLIAAMAVSLVMAFCAASAMAWGSATHAYIEEHINKKGPLLALNQVYGGMAADVFNFMTDLDQQAYLALQAHCGGFNKMWRTALLPTAKAETYGFISHNQAWGADFYAHNYSCIDNGAPTEGYIQEKAAILYPILGATIEGYLNPLLTQEQKQMLAMELLRDIIEYAVDILIIREDPAIGQKVTYAALLRSPEFPLLLNSTYALGFSRAFELSYFRAAKIIAAAETQFRQTMIGYGQLLALGESEATAQMPDQLAGLAQQLFGINVNADNIAPVLDLAIQTCHEDYMTAIENGINRTIIRVRDQMQSNGFNY